jgi:hypothetical protein
MRHKITKKVEKSIEVFLNSFVECFFAAITHVSMADRSKEYKMSLVTNSFEWYTV